MKDRRSSSAFSPSGSGQVTLNNLGAAALQCGELDEARDVYEKAVALNPEHSQALANLGVVLFRLNDLDRSAEVLRKAIEADANNADTQYNYSRTLRALGQLDDAETAARRDLDLMPGHVDARVHLGVTQAAKGEKEAAEASYRDAIKTEPRTAAAHHNLAQILLQSGRLSEGWEEFEWRWQTPDFQGAGSFRALPPWQGNPIHDSTLLVWTEQGVGDQILYAGMIPDVENMASNILIACTERLVPLFE